MRTQTLGCCGVVSSAIFRPDTTLTRDNKNTHPIHNKPQSSATTTTVIETMGNVEEEPTETIPVHASEPEGHEEEETSHRKPPNEVQGLFAWALMDVLMYVTVINLFVEYIPQMSIQGYSFTISLGTAIVLKLILEGVHALQHKFKHLFCGASKTMVSKLLGGFLIWLVLFGSKFVILWIDETIFQDTVDLGGVKLILVLSVALMIVEKFLRVLWAQLGQPDRWLSLGEMGQAAMH